VDEIAGYLHVVSDSEQIACPLPTELFEFYAIVMLFGCLVSAVERHCCSLCVFVPVIRDLLAVLRDVAGILRTTSAHAILRDTYGCLLARTSINNSTEASAAYCFTLQGRADIRKRESGFSTQNPDFVLESEFSGEVVNLKVSLRHRCSDDDVIVRLVEVIGNTTLLMTDIESAPSGAEGDFGASGDAVSGTEDGEEAASHEDYNEHLAYFVALAEHDLTEYDPYHDLYVVATRYLRTFAANLGLDESSTIALFDRWLFSAAPEVSLLHHLDGSEEPNMIWRAVHRFEEWSALSELALRLVTCGMSEADTERLLSMQRKIAGLHGKRFGLPSMEARLREWVNCSTQV
jgi:hypothetical protein